jgi:hypothetical protein
MLSCYRPLKRWYTYSYVLPPLVQEHQEQHLVVRLYHHHHQYPIKDENIIGGKLSLVI